MCLILAGCGCWLCLILAGCALFWLVVAGCALFWLDVAGCGLFWLVVAGSVLFWLVVPYLAGCGWLCLILAGCDRLVVPNFGWLWLVAAGCGWLWLVVCFSISQIIYTHKNSSLAKTVYNLRQHITNTIVQGPTTRFQSEIEGREAMQWENMAHHGWVTKFVFEFKALKQLRHRFLRHLTVNWKF